MVIRTKVVRTWEVQGFESPPPYLRVRKVLLSPSIDMIQHVSIGIVVIPPGSMTDPHEHEISEEIWIVIDGHGTVVIGEEKEVVEPGTVILVPPKKKHCLINDCTDPMKAYFIFAPPGPEQWLLEQINRSKGTEADK